MVRKAIDEVLSAAVEEESRPRSNKVIFRSTLCCVLLLSITLALVHYHNISVLLFSYPYAISYVDVLYFFLRYTNNMHYESKLLPRPSQGGWQSSTDWLERNTTSAPILRRAAYHAVAEYDAKCVCDMMLHVQGTKRMEHREANQLWSHLIYSFPLPSFHPCSLSPFSFSSLLYSLSKVP